jgi:hypothetical protein
MLAAGRPAAFLGVATGYQPISCIKRLGPQLGAFNNNASVFLCLAQKMASSGVMVNCFDSHSSLIAITISMHSIMLFGA